MSGFVLEGWALFAALLSVGAIGLLAGAALGFFSASTDLKREQSRAWGRGVDAGTSWESRRRRALPGEVLALPRDPYTGEALAPEPPVHDYPQGLFDQDEPPLQRAMRDALLPGDPDRHCIAPRVVADDGEELSPGSGQPGAGTLVIPRALLDNGTAHVVKFERGDD